MITDYEPTANSILQLFFRVCDHEITDKKTNYCKKCNSHIPLKEQTDIKNLVNSLENDVYGIYGGEYINKLVTFLGYFGKIIIESPSKCWHKICWEYDGRDMVCTYEAKHTQSFGYSICWLAEIARRVLLQDGITQDEIDEVIYG
jgi:hypothetical protein